MVFDNNPIKKANITTTEQSTPQVSTFCNLLPLKKNSDHLRREGLLNELGDSKLINYLSIYNSLIEDQRSGFNLYLNGGSYNAYYSSMIGVIDADIFALSEGIGLVGKYKSNELLHTKGIIVKSKKEANEFKLQLTMSRHMSTCITKASREIKQAAKTSIDHLEKFASEQSELP